MTGQRIIWSDTSIQGFPGLDTDIKAVANVIYNWINTSKGEMWWKPYMGLDLDDELFEIIDEISANSILLRLIAGLEAADPRIKVIPSRTIVKPVPDEYMFEVTLGIDVISLGAVTLDFTLNGSQ